MSRRSEAMRPTYGCGLDAFAQCFDVQSTDLLVAKIKSGELDAYPTLDKVVSWLAGNGAAPKTIWIYVRAVKSLLEHEDVLLEWRKLRRLSTVASGALPSVGTGSPGYAFDVQTSGSGSEELREENRQLRVKGEKLDQVVKSSANWQLYLELAKARG
jgi:hypothetical protein